ncbi:hypothetical protein GCM10027429_29160 [Marivirga atlantica]|jgi:hypothetical protein
MGFSTWPYAASIESVNDTYQFIADHADIYSEHIDSNIPWYALINNQPLPDAFIKDIANRKSHKISDKTLTISVSLLNSARTDLATDYDGYLPNFTSYADKEIEDAYFKHLEYITEQLQPDYLIVSIEANELLINTPERWDEYKILMQKIRTRIKDRFPSLMVSESVTLHNLYQANATENNEVFSYINNLDFVAVSFYPFFKGLNTETGFQDALDFLQSRTSKPIAFAETSHLSENLTVDSFNLFIEGNEDEQNTYLRTLLNHAQAKNYEYLIWWAHRDYDELWETFPDEAKDLGKIWISTGLINEDGQEKEAYASWQSAFSK